jgi:GntR family histidine utilization transcriptional repressor
MHDHAPDARRSTLHARIRADVEARILSGEWPPGTRIPTETALIAQYGCARMTVHKAIASLAASGLVIRNRRAGTIVARPRMQSAVLSIPDIRAAVEARGAAYAYRPVLDESRPPCCVHLGPEGHHLGVSRFLRGVHLSDDTPIMVEDRHIFLDAVPEAAVADFDREPPGAWLIGHVPWTDAEHRIAAIAAEASTARLLEVPTGAACLLVERRTRCAATTVTIARQVFRGDAYDLTARFGPSG